VCGGSRIKQLDQSDEYPGGGEETHLANVVLTDAKTRGERKLSSRLKRREPQMKFEKGLTGKSRGGKSASRKRRRGRLT